MKRLFRSVLDFTIKKKEIVDWSPVTISYKLEKVEKRVSFHDEKNSLSECSALICDCVSVSDFRYITIKKEDNWAYFVGWEYRTEKTKSWTMNRRVWYWSETLKKQFEEMIVELIKDKKLSTLPWIVGSQQYCYQKLSLKIWQEIVEFNFKGSQFGRKEVGQIKSFIINKLKESEPRS